MGIYSAMNTSAGLVDQGIGSAFDTVREVAENLEYIKHVSAHMEQVYNLSLILSAGDLLATHVDNTAAVTAGLTVGTAYKTATGEVRVVI